MQHLIGKLDSVFGAVGLYRRQILLEFSILCQIFQYLFE